MDQEHADGHDLARLNAGDKMPKPKIRNSRAQLGVSDQPVPRNARDALWEDGSWSDGLIVRAALANFHGLKASLWWGHTTSTWWYQIEGMPAPLRVPGVGGPDDEPNARFVVGNRMRSWYHKHFGVLPRHGRTEKKEKTA